MTITEMTPTAIKQIATINEFYVTATDFKMMRTFMSVGQDVLAAEWFSARGIYDKFGVDYRVFFKTFLSTTCELNIAVMFDEAKIDSLISELANKIKVNEKPVIASQSVPAVKLEVTTEAAVIEAPAVAAEVAAPTDNPAVIEAAPTKVEYKKQQANANFSLMLPLTEMIDTAVADYINNESGLLKNVSDRITAEAAKLRPNVIQIAGRPSVTLNGKMHVKFERALKLAIREGQVFLSGEAGTGKTTLAEQVAKALNLRFGHISCTAGMSEAHLLGRMDAHGNYLQSQFVDIYENGGLFLLDEVDAADSNTMLIINSALANGKMSVPNRKDKPTATRHKDFICFCAANTWGFGSNEYAGRNILDAAFLDRFVGSKLPITYDTALEAEISLEFPKLAVAIWQIRKNVVASKMRRVVSTRAIISGVKALLDGESIAEYLETFLTGWTTEEVSKAMNLVVVK